MTTAPADCPAIMACVYLNGSIPEPKHRCAVASATHDQDARYEHGSVQTCKENHLPARPNIPLWKTEVAPPAKKLKTTVIQKRALLPSKKTISIRIEKIDPCHGRTSFTEVITSLVGHLYCFTCFDCTNTQVLVLPAYRVDRWCGRRSRRDVDNEQRALGHRGDLSGKLTQSRSQ